MDSKRLDQLSKDFGRPRAGYMWMVRCEDGEALLRAAKRTLEAEEALRAVLSLSKDVDASCALQRIREAGKVSRKALTAAKRKR